ncbi:beta-1,6-N-acetylglucosaminyltransferase [Sphingomonas arenae]|uniref:beta-1,6-N-acetylglucosaminyltransferase n=1 Tax=Sphingomonas arenae TaxID=2812555 RepID=UPI00196744E8|nr:beta-1,6-N-acetylglucosaminyltransferase [Sphingomonas arenae]
MNVGFVMLSHRSPAQLAQLVRALSDLYGDPPIACHHDFSQSDLDASQFSSNVLFVRPSVRTGWGKWSLVEASLRALDRLYQAADPDAFFLISAADYPGARPEKVMSDLREQDADAWIDAFDLHEALAGRVGPGDPHLAHHRAAGNVQLAETRYLKALLKVPVIRLRPPAFSSTQERYPRLGRKTLALPFGSPRLPFGPSFRCHVGSQWFTARRSVAAKLLAPDARARSLQRYLRARVVPDECYFQSVICNDPTLTWTPRTFRLAFWEGGGAHPIEIGPEHLPQIAAEKPHFVRKLPDDARIRKQLDLMLGLNLKA